MPSTIDPSPSLRAARYVQYEMLWCLFSRLQQRLSAALATRPRRDNRLPQNAHTTPTVENIGPSMLELFTSLHRDFEAISALQHRTETLRRRLCNAQAYYDRIVSIIVQYDNDPSLDMEPHMARHHAASANLEHQITDINRDLAEGESTLAELERRRSSTWQEVFANVRSYFDSCFEVNFEACWALKERSCRWLRQMVDQVSLISHSETQIRQWDNKRISLQSSQRQAKKATDVQTTRLNLGLSRALDETRRHQVDAELDQVKSELAAQKDLLQLRRDFHSRDQDRFCRGIIEPLLEDAGRLKAGSAGPPNGSGASIEDAAERSQDQTQSSNEGPPLRDHSKSHSDGDNSANREVSKLTDNDLQEQYLDLRERLVEAQGDLNARHSTMETNELDHLLTFRNSSHEWYETFMAQELEEDVQAARVIEADLVELRKRLVQNGIKMPRSTDGLYLRAVKDGRIRTRNSDSASPKSPRRSLRRESHRCDKGNHKLNEWRMKADNAPRRSEITPSPGKSLAGSDLRSRSHSQTGSPDEELRQYRKTYLDQSRKQQEETRENAPASATASMTGHGAVQTHKRSKHKVHRQTQWLLPFRQSNHRTPPFRTTKRDSHQFKHTKALPECRHSAPFINAPIIQTRSQLFAITGVYTLHWNVLTVNMAAMKKTKRDRILDFFVQVPAGNKYYKTNDYVPLSWNLNPKGHPLKLS
ncbi:hypothetical protein M409DRAFT_51682 [Zasmidium cellare ATCC 36951]|uniref:Uncharacterized protein n=1 Tax=Zasmidium cellare ATCC 36951 TaxID=1080233 RepID=A0A6A6CWV0_ZASCE|nr:uncharacterized protein M409DRAFT_51682 [Zasmidium cellare ATCC 36951]KAF2170680.1 hypothetical protein M409DRAFT_51682 [Zasmidium cellare ATCC 36951]